MHLCQDEINALLNGLPLVEHLTCYARNAWYWLCTKICRFTANAEPRDGACHEQD